VTARFLPLAAAATLAAATSAAPQAVAGTVIGRDDERPVPGAWVFLHDRALTPLDSARTDDQGRFEVAAAAPGDYVLIVRLEGFLTVSATLTLEAGRTTRRRVEMPLVSTAAAALMRGAIEREAFFQIPIEELCREPLRPWEAGVLIGVTRDRRTLEPIPGALVELATGDSASSRVSTPSGAFWFCNVPQGEARIVVRAEGAPPDTSIATIRAGTISWYDGLIDRR
jgi:Carboxypeptidase regulatory-like domain